MHRIRITAVALALVAAAALAAGCGGRDKSEVVARVGSTKITRADLNRRLAELPPFSQQEFAGPEGIMRLLDRMVEEEVLYQAALSEGYASDPEVVEMIEKVRRRAMIQTYYEKEIEGTLEIPEEEIVDFYENSEISKSDWFMVPARIRFRHIMTETEARATEARRRVLAGESFSEVARDMSIDTGTREAGGLLPSVERGKGVPSSGLSPQDVERLFEWKEGEITQPFRSGRAWHIAMIDDKIEEGKKPLEQVRAQIVQSLRPRHMNKHFEETMERLRTEYRATTNEDAFRRKVRSEEELFTLAQDTEDPAKRLSYYSELVFNYPEGKHADEAQFMIGFIQAEELKNYNAAENALRRMLEVYPDSELADSARWLLENMLSEPPAFDEEGEETR